MPVIFISLNRNYFVQRVYKIKISEEFIAYCVYVVSTFLNYLKYITLASCQKLIKFNFEPDCFVQLMPFREI